MLTTVALVVGMDVRGGPIDVVGLYTLAMLINVAALLWACGIAMRFRSIQAGPMMQMPVFLILFAPVYSTESPHRLDRGRGPPQPGDGLARDRALPRR